MQNTWPKFRLDASNKCTQWQRQPFHVFTDTKCSSYIITVVTNPWLGYELNIRYNINHSMQNWTHVWCQLFAQVIHYHTSYDESRRARYKEVGICSSWHVELESDQSPDQDDEFHCICLSIFRANISIPMQQQSNPMILGTINPFVYSIEYAKRMRASAKCAQINRITSYSIALHVHSLARSSIPLVQHVAPVSVPLEVLKRAQFDIILWVSRVLYQPPTQSAIATRRK